MKKSLWIWIPLAAVLLTGCSGNDGADSIAEGMTAMENKEYQAALEDFAQQAWGGKSMVVRLPRRRPCSHGARTVRRGSPGL